VGLDNARKWAKTDKYFIGLQDLSGGAKNPQMVNLVDKAQSKDMVTFQELEVQLVKGEPIRVLYWRDGSGGPWGYIEGRAWEFVWDGT
jgi:hypothetical protein